MPSPLIPTPTPTYRDVRGAIDFLVEAFGFERHAVHEHDDGTLAHVELTLGEAMLMPATPGNGDHSSLLTDVQAAGKPTSGFYVVVDDAEAHCERARAAGATIVTPLRARDHGGSEYTCHDLEGHLWTFGTYDPWT